MPKITEQRHDEILAFLESPETKTAPSAIAQYEFDYSGIELTERDESVFNAYLAIYELERKVLRGETDTQSNIMNISTLLRYVHDEKHTESISSMYANLLKLQKSKLSIKKLENSTLKSEFDFLRNRIRRNTGIQINTKGYITPLKLYAPAQSSQIEQELNEKCGNNFTELYDKVSELKNQNEITEEEMTDNQNEILIVLRNQVLVRIEEINKLFQQIEEKRSEPSLESLDTYTKTKTALEELKQEAQLKGFEENSFSSLKSKIITFSNSLSEMNTQNKSENEEASCFEKFFQWILSLFNDNEKAEQSVKIISDTISNMNALKQELGGAKKAEEAAETAEEVISTPQTAIMDQLSQAGQNAIKNDTSPENTKNDETKKAVKKNDDLDNEIELQDLEEEEEKGVNDGKNDDLYEDFIILP